MVTPKEAIDRINRRFGAHAGFRALHAKGLFCRARFSATPEAAKLTKAEHMSGEPVETLVRLSNGGGDPNVPDYAPELRGLAVSFRPPGGEATDIVSQTAPRFAVRTVEGFLDLVEASAQDISRAWKFPVFLAKHREALPTLRANLPALRPPESFATLTFYAIHAYRWVDAEGGSRHVRYTWVPAAGDQRISAREAKKRGRDYLQDDLRDRLDKEPIRYTLRLQVAAPGDAVDDPVAAWPDDRETVDAGTLEVSEVIADPEPDELVVFDPVRVIEGIELSDDPILRYRPEAYSESVNRRVG